MKKIFIVLILLFSTKSIGQYKKILNYNYNGEEIKYSRIDYSQYGVAGIYVTAYEKNETNKLIEKSAINYLKGFKNIYHTLYFFIEIPSKYNFEEKQIIFNEIMIEIDKNENLKKIELFFNFDIDYSIKYQSEIFKHRFVTIKRIYTAIDSENIKFGLLN
jgi:hypothetical protein